MAKRSGGAVKQDLQLVDNWQQGGFSFTNDGITVTGRPGVDDYRAACVRVGRRRNVASWHAGDLMVYGEARGDWNDTRDQAVEGMNISPDRRMAICRLVEAFPPDSALAEGSPTLRGFMHLLTFSHHEAVLIVDDIDKRLEWLQKAVDQGWTVGELREHLRPTLDGLGGGDPPEPKTVKCPECGAVFKPEKDA